MSTRSHSVNVIVAMAAVVLGVAVGGTMLAAIAPADQQANCAMNLARFGQASAHYETVFNSFAPCDPWYMMPRFADPDDSSSGRSLDVSSGEQFDPPHSWLAFYGLGLRPNIPAEHNRSEWNNQPFGFSIQTKNWHDEVWSGFLCPSQNIVNTMSYASEEIEFSSTASQPMLGILNPQASGYMVNRLLRSAARGRSGDGSRGPRLPDSPLANDLSSWENVYSTPSVSLSGLPTSSPQYIQAINSSEVVKPNDTVYMADSLDYRIGHGEDGDELAVPEGWTGVDNVDRSAGTYHAMSNTKATVLGARHNGKANVLYVDGHVDDQNQTPRNRRGDLITASTFADYVDDEAGFGSQHHVAPGGRYYDATWNVVGGFAPGDDEAPTVVATSPTNGGSVRSTEADTVTVSFSEQVWINETNVSVDSGAVVPVAVEYSFGAGVTLTFDPPLSNDLHIVTVSAAVTDVVGNQLDGDSNGTGGDDYIFAFTVTDGTTVLTPGDDIQAAIDAAADGDVLILQPGTYTGPAELTLRGKAITLRGSDPADWSVVAATVLDDTGVHIDQGEGSDTVIEGVTLTSGYPYHHFAGITIDGASPTIRRCRFVDNVRSGVVCMDGAPVIEACVFSGNTADYGAAIALYGSAALVRNNVIRANHATDEGGAIYSVMAVADLIFNNTIMDNTADGAGLGGSAILCVSGDVSLANNILTGNGLAPIASLDAEPQVVFNLFDVLPIELADPINHNLEGDPGFVDAGAEVPQLTYGSPCVNAGNWAWGLLHGETDIDGDVRSALGRVDIGADEIAEPEVLTVDDDGPADFNTIQGAIDAAIGHQEIILVSPGTYPEQINFLGKAITVTGTDPDDASILGDTVLDGYVRFDHGEQRASVLAGLTITRTEPNSHAGIVCEYDDDFSRDVPRPTITKCVISQHGSSGIHVINGAPLITGNTISQNTASNGAGIRIDHSEAEIVGNRIEGNHATNNGGGIYGIDTWGVVVDRNMIVDNVADGSGGGVWLDCYSKEPLAFTNTVVARNSSPGVAGVYVDGYDIVQADVRNCTIAFNVGERGVSWGTPYTPYLLPMTNCIVYNPDVTQELGSNSSAPTRYSLVRDWTSTDPVHEGTFDGVPGFVDAVIGDYRLGPNSPCVNTGDPEYAPAWPTGGELDVAGYPRIHLGRVDIGAHELFADCNGNYVDDAEDIADGTSEDVNANGRPDECEDCNGNGVLDPDDIAAGTSDDCNGDGIPDECQLEGHDCNANGVRDECELDGNDCNGNGIPDDCELEGNDCNGNGVPDECDMVTGDCDGNGVLDVCELTGNDCNANGILDRCELVDNDCNANGILDDCELAGNDENGNGWLDECENPLVWSEPTTNSTLSKVRNNCVLLRFDQPIALPGGPVLRVQPLGGGADLGGSFTYTVEPDGLTLKAQENGKVLANRTWYRFEPVSTFIVTPFGIDVCELIGDADGNGQVLASDLGLIWSHNAELTDARYDVDGNGQVLASDLSWTWLHNGEAVPPKP